MRNKLHLWFLYYIETTNRENILCHCKFLSDIVLNPETQFQFSFAATILTNKKKKKCHGKDDETNLED